jgi:hypothetical protein
MDEANGIILLTSSPEIETKIEASVEAFTAGNPDYLDSWGIDILKNPEKTWEGETYLERFCSIMGLEHQGDEVNEDGTTTWAYRVSEKWHAEDAEVVLQHLASLGVKIDGELQSEEDGESWSYFAEPYGTLVLDSMSTINDSELATLREKAAAFDRIAEPFASDGFSISDLGHHVFHLVTNYSKGDKA